MNGHPRDQAKVSVHCRWPLIRGNLTLKCVGTNCTECVGTNCTEIYKLNTDGSTSTSCEHTCQSPDCLWSQICVPPGCNRLNYSRRGEASQHRCVETVNALPTGTQWLNLSTESLGFR